MASTSVPPSALSFPPATFAKLSPAPYLLAHLKPSSSSASATRPSGRSPSDFRQPTINTRSLTHAYGSAVVRVGDTAVVCGIRPEILKAGDIPHPFRSISGNEARNEAEKGSREIEELGLLVPNIELSTGCSPAHLPGNAPGSLAQSLTQRVLSLLHISRLVDASQLRIQYQTPPTDDDIPDAPPVVVTRAYWALYIDILFISLDGNPFDAAWAAILAALNDTKLPNAWWDADREMILCSEKASEAKKMSLRSLPIASTFAVFSTASPQKKRSDAESWLLADPDAFEHDLCGETITVVTDGSKKILRIEKNGGRVVGRDAMREIVEKAQARWNDWDAIIVQEKR
ncbi:ribosomal protein S5 domain 2-type protein [Delphinella strobiligena]|nr:ribosomal protein S5 domain 2-type protein [Delphinella strobiligena]